MKHDYHERQERRRTRYAELADKAAAESRQRSTAVHQMAGAMNGQPILVGHHSEKRHRRDIQRMDDNMRKSVEADRRSRDYAAKAAGVGTGGISSDDPDAIELIREKIAKLEAQQAQAKAVNKAVRASKGAAEVLEAKLADLGLPPSMAIKLLTPDFCGRIGIPNYAMALAPP